MSEQPNGTTVRNRNHEPRWWPAIVILTIGIGRQVWIWNVWPADRTMQTIHSYLWGIPTVLLLGIWWLCFSRQSWRTRGWGVGAVLACVAVLSCLLRVDDVTGEVFPIFAWRWTPRTVDVGKAYVKEQRRLQREQEERAREQEQIEENASATVPGQVEKTKNSSVDTNQIAAVTPASQTQTEIRKSVGEKSIPQVTDADWPEFRGAQRDGVWRGGTIRTDWDVNPPVALWRHPVGPAWSSFSVVDGLAFTQEQRVDEMDHDAEAVVCYDVWSGKQVWEHLDLVKFTHGIGGDGPRATPTWNAGRLYSFGATGILNCLDAKSGKLYWSQDVLNDYSISNAEYGMTGSPLIHGDVVIVNAGGNNGNGVLAFHRLTGELIWKHGSDKAGYASPQINEVDGVAQILIFDAAGVAGHDLNSGEQLWKYPWANSSGINASQPILAAKDQVFVSTSYGKGGVLLQVRHSKQEWSVEPLWESNQLRLKFNCGLVRDQYLYGLDEGILTCFDLRDGTRKWKGGRYSFGQTLLIGDELLVLAESGEVVLVAADPHQFRELKRFQAIDGKTWNNPAIWKGLLLVRNGAEAACYDLRGL